jgi:nicotinate phosphoribosyltransferase
MEKFLNIQDQYKFPMGQLIYEQEPDARVTFAMTNRKATSGMRIADYIAPEELQEYYDELRNIQITPEEIAILENQKGKNYTKEYLGYLAAFRLPEISVSIDPTVNDITARTTGPWNDASLWEIPMLSAIPELYYPRYIEANGGTMAQVWDEGNRRLTETIELFKAHPQVKFAEFGTRRRFSGMWQGHSVGRFSDECPDNIIGTSNALLADMYGITASGTNAHELTMVDAALTESRGGNPLDGQIHVIQNWIDRFPTMPVALIDTFTSDVTLASMTDEQIERVMSYRIDSGDEYIIGQKVIDFLKSHGIDPRTRTLFFSNSLTPQKAIALEEGFRGKINVLFGIGGHAVNNMGFDAKRNLPNMNIVAKAVAVNGHGTVKLSDDPGKHMGNPEDVARYQFLARERLGRLALLR